MEHILDQLEPTFAKIGGRSVPMMFNMKAAALMERELDKPLTEIVDEISGTPGEDGKVKSLPWETQAVIISCMIRGAGVSVSPDELMAAVHMLEAQDLANAAIAEMMRKQPTGKAKNG